MYERLFIFALCATITIEVLVVLAAARLTGERLPIVRLFGCAALASFITLPYVWFVIPPFVPAQLAIPVTEAFALVFEAVFYKYALPSTWIRASAYSLAANLASYTFGVWYWSQR